jgi:hypothetical protein
VSFRDAALGLPPSYDPTSRQVVTPFESLVRPLIGDAYDAAFPERSTEADASLSADEQSMVQALCELHARAACIEDEDVRATARHALVLSLKALRKSAETRKKRDSAVAKRKANPLYQFRAITPDGKEIVFPKRPTRHVTHRYALLRRPVLRPVEQIEANVRADYASRWARVMPNSQRDQLANEILGNIEAEIAEQEDQDFTWRFWDNGGRLDLFEKRAQKHRNHPRARWPDEFTVIEGTPFNIDTGEDQ